MSVACFRWLLNEEGLPGRRESATNLIFFFFFLSSAGRPLWPVGHGFGYVQLAEAGEPNEQCLCLAGGALRPRQRGSWGLLGALLAALRLLGGAPRPGHVLNHALERGSLDAPLALLPSHAQVIYGGQTFTHTNGGRCYDSSVMVYDLSCDAWLRRHVLGPVAKHGEYQISKGVDKSKQ